MAKFAHQMPLVDWLLKMVSELPDEEAPVTYALVILTTIVLVIEVVMTVYYGLPRIQIFSTGLFGVYPEIAWVSSPVLHRGPLHWLANVLILVFLGAAVERHWPRRRYIVFILIAGYGATAIGAAIMLTFSTNQIAFYGSSGIGFALAGFALVHLPWSHLQVTRVEWFAAFLGVSSLLTVLIDPLTGPYLHPDWINGGHMGGFVIGVIAGWYDWNRCELRY